VATQPAGAAFDEFDWRISLATIASDGPFSAFPGVDRTIMLVAGAGVRLSGADVDHVLDRVGVPFSFSGEVALDSELFAGEVMALNVMTRQGRCRSEVVVLDEAGEVPPSDAALVMSLQGAWRVEVQCDGQLQPLPDLAAHDGLWWVGPGGVRTVSPVVGEADEPGVAPRLAAVRIFRL
jgi:environmental stress-induced protein Ves